MTVHKLNKTATQYQMYRVSNLCRHRLSTLTKERLGLFHGSSACPDHDHLSLSNFGDSNLNQVQDAKIASFTAFL